MSVEIETPIEFAAPASRVGWLVDRALARLSTGSRRTLLAILDQALASGTRFVTTICVGRLCGPQELGNYALAFTFYSLVACVQEALVSMPFTFFHRRVEDRAGFSGSVLMHCLLLGLSGSVMLILLSMFGGPWFSSVALQSALMAMAITLPFSLLIEFSRRFSLAELDLVSAIRIDATMAALQLLAIATLMAVGKLTTPTALLAIGVAASIAGAGWFRRNAARFQFSWSAGRDAAARNWQFGRWGVGSQLIFVARSTVTPWLLAALAGTAATGIYAACEMVILLANPLLLAFNNVLAPQSSEAFVAGGTPAVRKLVVRATLALTVFTTLLSLVFIAVGSQALGLAYGPAYADQGYVVLLFALAIVAEGVGMASANGLWAIERPHVNFVACAAGTVVALAVTAATVSSWSILGAAFGSLCGRVVTSALLCSAFMRESRVPSVEGGTA